MICSPSAGAPSPSPSSTTAKTTYQLQLVAGDAISSEELIAGPASDGTLLTFPPAPSGAGAAEFAAKVAEGVRSPSFAYAAVQAWAQAVEKAGTFETEAVAVALRTHEFDTVLGRIGFDDKGDVYGYETFVWYVWQDGKYAPVEPGKLTE